MTVQSATQTNQWDEDTTQQFLDYGRYFVPDREKQWAIISRLLAGLPPEASVMELCCGEGLLAEVLLAAYPSIRLHAFDGSPEMLAQARHRLSDFGGRVSFQHFDLADIVWRSPPAPVHAIVSSLAIHHLFAPQKQQLYRDLYGMLAPGGVLVIADIVEVPGQTARRLAAEEWDAAVRQRSLDLDGDTRAFEFFVGEGWNMHRYLDPEDIDHPSPLLDQLKWLEIAGFVEVDVYWLAAGHAIFGGRKD